ncbi:GGDEF domain-containing protein [uncultured Sphingomonas sp.]|uniref:GGDEF domain-containing protein n=1 Tax=uncultured Sphingomonas sp. TaxID=158754 RepID=UPI0025DE4381|nr:GGDEF domain-containing protein [uncultured Sphingomonas sp.]
MTCVERPTNAEHRVRALAALDLIGAPPEREFDALAALAAELLACPMGVVSIIDAERFTPLAASGIDAGPAPREHVFCNRTIVSGGEVTIADARQDGEFAASPLVTQAPHIRSYAGIAISAPDPDGGPRVPVGAVCGLDIQPRAFTAEQHAVLGHLKALAEALFDARALRVRAEKQSAALRRNDRVFRQAERLAEIGWWRLELADETLVWSDGIYRIYDIDPETPPELANAMDYFPENARATVAGALATTMETGAPFDIEIDFVSAKGVRRRVRSMGELELSAGRPVAVVGVFQDITARHALEQRLRRSASVDSLTRIANRAAFNTEMERWIAVARSDESPLELVLIDLDFFKHINDAHGHLAGDEVLRAFGRRLRRVHPTDAFAARVGGDEFALLLRGDAARRAAELVARLLVDLKMPVHAAVGIIPVSGTIGHATFDAGEDTLHAFVHRADTALYQAKRTERGTARAWGQLREGDRRDAVKAA